MATQPGSKPKVTTISTKQLAATLAGDHEMPKKQAEAILGDLGYAAPEIEALRSADVVL